MLSKPLNTILVGLGGTFLIDCWSILLRLGGVKSNGLIYVGRWVAYLSEGRVLHDTIMHSAAVKNEVFIGWSIHYLVGILFAFLLVKVYGSKWLTNPTLLPAIAIAMLSMLVPLCFFQPAFGFGIAFYKTPNQAFLLLRFIAIHLVYGFGIFISAKIINITTAKYSTNENSYQQS